MNEGYLLFSSIAKLLLAILLFSRVLSRRNNFALRLALVAAAGAGLGMAAPTVGLSLYPPLSDDLSFLRAILSFLALLSACVLAQRALFRCPPYTSLFCCSMAYLIENLSSAADRTLVVGMGRAGADHAAVFSPWHYWAISALVFAIAYFALVRRMEKNGLMSIDDPFALLVSILTIMLSIILDLVVKDLGVLSIPGRYQVSLSIIYLALCIYVLYSAYEIVYSRRLRLDMIAIDRLRQMEARQYQVSRENMRIINRRAHDMRRLVNTLRSEGWDAVGNLDGKLLSSASRELDVYDSAVETGNTALDTILTEKRLLCASRGIVLSCIADGQSLGFVRPADLYTLFGNALDNAINAVVGLHDDTRLSISLVVRRHADIVSIHMENYCDPHSATPETDGLGLDAMRVIVESYGGALSTSTTEDVSHLNVLLPVPEGRP